VLLFQRFFEPITTLGDDWQTMQSALSGVERIFEVLALPPDARSIPEPAGRKHEAIEIRDLVFGYLPDRPVLRGVSVSVRTGEHVALVGRTGDRVIVVEAGRIVEEGPPEELVRRGGRFAALIELEAAGWNWQAER
jgi:ABC-type multidrug transport system fused ATPase/permease subunit